MKDQAEEVTNLVEREVADRDPHCGSTCDPSERLPETTVTKVGKDVKGGK